jgi:hypothetical protein
MENNNNMDEDVMNLLAILQQNPTEEKVGSEKAVKKPTTKKSVDVSKKEDPSVLTEKKEVTKVKKAQSTFMADINEPEDKSVYNSKVLIREEIYEIFMSLKRIKKIKSVSTLIDFALQEYMKNNKEDIKKALYDNKNHEIL